MRRSNFNQIFWGLVILVVGVLFLAQNLGYLQDYSFWRYLPALLIILGLYQLFINKFHAWTGSVLVIVIGTYLLLATLQFISWGTFGSLIWPTILIMVGLTIILHRGRMGTPFQTTETSEAKVFASFGEQKSRISDQNFKGGEVSAMFGSSKLDLRDAKISQPPARIQTTTMFGGVEIFIPQDWDVDIQTVNFFGGSSDNRRSNQAQKEVPDLIVSGTVMFGGLEVKS